MTPSVVLASGSPRRRELLGMYLHNFIIDPAKGDEHIPDGMHAQEAVRLLARAKAEEVAARHPDSVVIGADTVVALDGKILGKPHDEADAASMLRTLSDRTHTVYTGVCVIGGGYTDVRAEETKVHFRSLNDDEIAAYIASGEPMDKAGAYGYQGLAGMFVRGIEGDFFNVVGLPLCLLGEMLESVGVRLL